MLSSRVGIGAIKFKDRIKKNVCEICRLRLFWNWGYGEAVLASCSHVRCEWFDKIMMEP